LARVASDAVPPGESVWENRLHGELLAKASRCANVVGRFSKEIAPTQSIGQDDRERRAGYDAAKKIKGRERMVTDTGSLLLGADAPADIQDRDGAVRSSRPSTSCFLGCRTCAPTASTTVQPLPSSVTGPSRSSNAPLTLLAFDCCRGGGSPTNPRCAQSKPPGKDFEASMAKAKACAYVAFGAAAHQAISLTLTTFLRYL
jgi:hypothetical protein